MADQEKEKRLKALSLMIDTMLKDIYNEELGFCICVASFEKEMDLIAITNADKNDTITLLKAGIEYFEKLG